VGLHLMQVSRRRRAQGYDGCRRALTSIVEASNPKSLHLMNSVADGCCSVRAGCRSIRVTVSPERDPHRISAAACAPGAVVRYRFTRPGEMPTPSPAWTGTDIDV